MSLNRNQATLCAIGGVFAVGAAALGWFLWSAIGDSGEALEERDNSMRAIDNFYSAKVFPSAESLETVKANTGEIAEWRETAKLVAARGDKSFHETTPPSFKQFLQSEQVRLSALPGRVDGKICATGFAFGFDKYLGQSPTMPERADLPKLQRQLDFIADAVELFSEAGVDEVKLVKRDDKSATVVEEEQPAPRPARKGRQGEAVADEGPVTTSLDYSFQILASPKALVAVVNKLNSEFRFTVVTELNFTESRDVILENFAARDKAEAEAKSGQRSGRVKRRIRGEAVELVEEQAEKPAEGGIVIDPEIDAPLTVDLTVRVYDFGEGIAVADSTPEPASEPAAEAPADDAAAGEPKAEDGAAAKPDDAAPAEEAKEEAAK